MGREEIRSGNVLLTEKDKPQWFNEIAALNWKSSGFLHETVGFHSS